MTDTRWMTYDELAAALGITPDSARRLVARKKWPRKAGNDGRARIGVPAERIPDRPPVGAPDEIPDDTPDSPADARDDITPVIRVLSQHIERLEKELESVRAERDIERARAADLALKAAQVDALNAVLDAEKKRAEEIGNDRDRWAAQAERLSLPAPTQAKRGWWPFRKAM